MKIYREIAFVSVACQTISLHHLNTQTSQIPFLFVRYPVTFDCFLDCFPMNPVWKPVLFHIGNNRIPLLGKCRRHVPRDHHIDVIFLGGYARDKVCILRFKILIQIQAHQHSDSIADRIRFSRMDPLFDMRQKFFFVPGKTFWRREIAGRPVVNIGKKFFYFFSSTVDIGAVSSNSENFEFFCIHCLKKCILSYFFCIGLIFYNCHNIWIYLQIVWMIQFFVIQNCSPPSSHRLVEEKIVSLQIFLNFHRTEFSPFSSLPFHHNAFWMICKSQKIAICASFADLREKMAAHKGLPFSYIKLPHHPIQ